MDENFFTLKKPAKAIVFLALLTFLALVSTYTITLPKADDMARHLKNGELILHGNFDILYKNVYSYTQPDYPVVNHHWLSGVVYYLLFQIAGWNGLVVIKVIFVLAAFTILFWVALKKADFWLVAFFSIPTLLMLMERTMVRPENFSYLLVAIYLYLLTDIELHPESKKIYWIVPLQMLWVNLHIFFFIGVGLISAFLIEKIILQRNSFRNNQLVQKLLIVAVLATASCLLNPNGITGALYPLTIFHNYGVPVSENVNVPQYFRTNTLFTDYPAAIFIPLIMVLALSFIFGFRKKQKPIFYGIVAAASAMAGFELIRAMVLFGLMFLPAVTLNLNDIFLNLKEKFKTQAPRLSAATGKITIWVMLLAIGGLTFFFWGKIDNHGIGLDYRSEDSARFFQDNNLKGPIFNDYDSGSYLVYYFFPREKVWMDNRPEAYSANFFNHVNNPLLADDGAWAKTLEKYQFNVIFFYQYDEGDNIRTFLSKRVRDPSWSLVYTDIYNVILVRNVPENQDVIQKFAITPQNAVEKLAYLTHSENIQDQITAADTFNLLGLGDLATQTFFNVLSKDPNQPKLWMVLGEWELSKQDYRSPLLAMMFLDKAITLGQKTAEAYYYLGSAYVKLDRPENAREALGKAIEINPYRQDARDLLTKLKTQ